MSNPLVSARVEVPASCPVRAENDPDSGVHFTIGSTVNAVDVPVELVFERGALRRFVALARELLAESEPAERGDGASCG
jgi:hypothetical protein